VARGTQHRKRRPSANARVAHQQAPAKTKRVRHQAWENQLFFGRLRTHGRFLWYLLAAVFVLGFVFLGIGSGSTGISTILQNFFSGTSASGSSLSSLQKKTVQNPKDAAAWLAYANKLQQKNKPDDAAQALQTYTTLRPKDEDVLRQLAALYYSRAADWDTLYQQALARTQAIMPTQPLTPKSSSRLGHAISSLSNPLNTAVSSQASQETNNDYSQVANYLSETLGVWKKIAKLSPQDASTQLSLAQAATNAQDTATAIAAYKAFLKLAPGDSQAPAARKTLKQLELQAKASASAATGSGK